jgi:hypothetical protein
MSLPRHAFHYSRGAHAPSGMAILGLEVCRS